MDNVLSKWIVQVFVWSYGLIGLVSLTLISSPATTHKAGFIGHLVRRVFSADAASMKPAS